MKPGYSRPRRARVLPALRALAVNDMVFASTREIARAAGCSHPTVREAIADLEARGALTVIYRGGHGREWSAGTYRLYGGDP